jgi:hypothetical protein
MPGQLNESWGNKDSVFSILNYLIDFSNPMICVVSSYDQTVDVFRDVHYFLGWLTYTRDPAMIAALAGDPHVTPFRDGVLITVGEDVTTMETEETLKQLARLRDKLTAAGITSWPK